MLDNKPISFKMCLVLLGPYHELSYELRVAKSSIVVDPATEIIGRLDESSKVLVVLLSFH